MQDKLIWGASLLNNFDPYKMCLSNSFTLQNLQTGSVIQHNEGEKIEKHIYKQIDYVYCCNSNGNFYFETKMIL